ncbi:DUF2520 domain-containing protein [Flavobacterium amniphilum]|uniref:Rossmann-like and DUF2520 domain-containing protein n=1 Tax=Flavobacterium amniphilum TaxID=1834035 RepID=UPI00202A7C75|nr:DUF2520 domain-containing protein [Flavobacterium amniphilum]MCL9805731.1 DUF2520 domain-containing protein [Flavobacterium amniphilum]MCL9806318.1 DUF2520 domain-containing protein [Flavobacterium amniphilum]
MIQVTIIGSGNVARHLISAFSQSSFVEIKQVFARQTETLSHLIPSEKITNNFAQIQESDLYIISVTDQAIESVSAQIPFENKLVVHTSGTVSIDNLSSRNRKGVFYPLQTFSKDKKVNFKEIPVCLEAQNEEDYLVLESVAKSISDKPFNISSEQRKALHVAAVFSCNFVNHLYRIGSEICTENNIPFEILYPLIEETADKIKFLSPEEAQTGPAKRNDTTTINAHLNFLQDNTQKEIYKLLTKSIIDNGKKL